MHFLVGKLTNTCIFEQLWLLKELDKVITVCHISETNKHFQPTDPDFLAWEGNTTTIFRPNIPG